MLQFPPQHDIDYFRRNDYTNKPRSPYLSSPRPLPPPSPLFEEQQLADILLPGDIIGQGISLKGEPLRLVANNPNTPWEDAPSREFQVVKELGEGSYAVVYLVQEVLERAPSSSEGMDTIGWMDGDGAAESQRVVYGRKFAIKCLSKRNLDNEALDVQMSEVDIHQSLRLHDNIVTLHRTLETSSFLLLVLEYVPGEDLFYFLEQSRDHEPLSPSSPSPSSSYTPPTPSLLSTLHPTHLLSRTRLRLIASMFSQMCDAVAACHSQSVFHRDIKPENFIVTDTPSYHTERRVLVKLTDFGLSTRETQSADMDCGSAPYMSYECRNNVAPTYAPREADVWSLGIVLINMLYHTNPWTDTSLTSSSSPSTHSYFQRPPTHTLTPICSSFATYLNDPIGFFMSRFVGMSLPLAELLASKVFCILEDTESGEMRQRMEAREFGKWVKDNLVNVLAVPLSSAQSVQRTASTASVAPSPVSGTFPTSATSAQTQANRLSLTMPSSYRPTSRPPSVYSSVGRLSVQGTPVLTTIGLPIVGGGATMVGKTLSRAPSLSLMQVREVERISMEEQGLGLVEVGDDTVMADVTMGEVENGEVVEEQEPAEVETASRSTSTTRRRKRGLRKGRGASSHSHVAPSTTTTHASTGVNASTTSSAVVQTDLADAHAQAQIHHHPEAQVNAYIQDKHDETHDTLAAASQSLQSLAREISMASRSKASSIRSVSTNASSVKSGSVRTTSTNGGRVPYEPASMYALPEMLLSGSQGVGGSMGAGGAGKMKVRSPLGVEAFTDLGKEGAGDKAEKTKESGGKENKEGKDTVTRKPSRWKLSFGRSAGSSVLSSNANTTEETSNNNNKSPAPSIDLAGSTSSLGSSGRQHLNGYPHPQTNGYGQRTMSTKASNVSNLIMGLSPPPAPTVNSSSSMSMASRSSTSLSSSVGSLAPAVPPLPSGAISSLNGAGSGSQAGSTFGFGTGMGIGSGVPPRPLVSGVASPRGRVNGPVNINSVNLASPPHPGRNHHRNRSPGRSGAGAGAMSSSPPNGAAGQGHYQTPHHRAISPPRGGNGKAKASWRSGPANSSATDLNAPNANANGSTGSFTRYPNTSARSVATTNTTNSIVSTTTMGSLGSLGSMGSLGSRGSLGSLGSLGSMGSLASNGTVGTSATSVSGTSWRASVKTSSTHGSHASGNGGVPRNIKIMDGVPWELDQLPRGQHPNPVGDIFGSPPIRNHSSAASTTSSNLSGGGGKQRTRKHKDLKLDTISERPGAGPASFGSSYSYAYASSSVQTPKPRMETPAEKVRRDAQTSTSDLVGGGKEREEMGDGVKKVQKGQINALAKMLSALRR